MGIIFWSLVGLISGFTTSILFIRMDKSFWDKVTTWGPNVGVLGSSLYMQMANNPSHYDAVFLSFVLQSGGWILSFFGVIFVFCKSSKKYNVTIGDVISGRHLRIIDLENTISEQDRRKTSLFSLQSLIEKEGTRVEKEKKILEDQKNKSICLHLVSEARIPICQEHATQCPNFARRLAETIPFIKEAVSESLNHLKKSLRADISKHPDTIIETTSALLQLISIYINKYLLKEEGCRVHFRVQGPDSNYKKFVATIGCDPRNYKDELKVIPYKNSMIERSFQSRSPAVKSLNPSYHVDGNNDGRWPEYITIAFDELTINKLPLVSMGISFPHTSIFYELCIYLCQVRFDWILKDLLKDYFELINNQDDAIKAQAIRKMMMAA
jgi:hypothetical protein